MSDLRDRLAALGLAEWPEPVELSLAEVEAMCTTAAHEGLAALLGAAREAGRVRMDEAAASVVSAAWAERMAWCVRLDGVLLDVVARLAGAGIDTRVLKGVAIATLDEPDPSWRSYGDIDILVPDGHFLAAVDVLAAAGWHPAVPPVSRRWSAEYAKSITLVDGSGVQLDLHRLLAVGVLGEQAPMAELFAEGTPFTVGGVALTGLAPVHRFLHACYHAALGGVAGTRHRRDVLLLAHSVAPAAVEARCTHGWSAAAVAHALRWAGASGGLPPDWQQWLATRAIDPADRARLAASQGTFRAKAGARARNVGGPVARVRYLAALVWPSRAHLVARGRSRRQHLVRVLRAP